MSANAEEVDVRRVRMALMSLGSPPQAQRHHVRVGLLQRSCAGILDLAPKLAAMETAGRLDHSQAAALAAVGGSLAGLERGWQERIPPVAASLGFEFLLSDAFEDPEWESLRLVARGAFTVMRAPDNPRIG